MRIDASDFLHQKLTADGHYDETRRGRPHAFQGRFWIDGARIDYLGFWAFGNFGTGSCTTRATSCAAVSTATTDGPGGA